MTAEAQIYAIGTCAIGIITILNILVALHLSRVLYKSTLFMQNKANLLNSRMNVSPVLTKDYENKCLRRAFKNKAKQTQSNPISNPALSAPKNTPNFPVFSQFWMFPVLNYNRFTERLNRMVKCTRRVCPGLLLVGCGFWQTYRKQS